MSDGGFADKPQIYLRQFLGLWWIPLMLAVEQYSEAVRGREAIPIKLVSFLVSASVLMVVADYVFFVKKENRKRFATIVSVAAFFSLAILFFSRQSLQQSLAPEKSPSAPAAVSSNDSMKIDEGSKANIIGSNIDSLSLKGHSQLDMANSNVGSQSFKTSPRSQEMAKLSNSEIFRRAAMLASELRKEQAIELQRDRERTYPPIPNSPDDRARQIAESIKSSEARNKDLNDRFYGRASDLMVEIATRVVDFDVLPPSPDDFSSSPDSAYKQTEIYIGARVLASKTWAGSAPLSDVASLLEFAAAKLPQMDHH